MIFRPVLATVATLAGLVLAGETVRTNWALGRIGSDGTGTRRGGRGVTIYVIDTGVRTTHPEFGDRAHMVGDFLQGAPGGPEADDCASPDGHGTLNASLAAGARFGVAPEATIQALRAAGGRDCRGDAAATTRAVEWITAHGARPAVVNLSFRFSSPELNAAIHQSVSAGFVYTLSAGTAGDVTAYWGDELPAETVIAASTDVDDRALRTDYGPALTLFAPGIAVTGAGLRDDGRGFTPAREQSGDSFAAPLAAGVAALYLEHHPSATPHEVRQALIDAAAAGRIRNPGRSPNRLLHLVSR